MQERSSYGVFEMALHWRRIWEWQHIAVNKLQVSRHRVRGSKLASFGLHFAFQAVTCGIAGPLFSNSIVQN